MKNHPFHIAFFALSIGIVSAQTTNVGKMYISENTVFSTVETLDNRENAEIYNDGQTFIYSNFNNNGIFDFLNRNGATLFVGNEDQQISGLETSFFQNIYFKNTSSDSPFLLSGTIEISGFADFVSGIVDNLNFGGNFFFREGANHRYVSDKSFVLGAVGKLGNDEFIFPIGYQDNYRPAKISAPQQEGSFFEGKYFFSNSHSLYDHNLKAGAIDKINDAEFWTLSKKSSNNEDVLVTLSYNENTTPDYFLNAARAEQLVIVRWDETSNLWVNEGGIIDPNMQSVTTAAQGYGTFTFATLKSDEINPGGVIIYNAVTPNGDGINDFFFIDFPKDGSIGNLQVQIFNRWGKQVFESSNYGINDDVFNGFSKGKLNVDGREQLPTGTYFYTLRYSYNQSGSTKNHKQAGYLYLSGN